jgi:hypothetical protein
MAAAFGDKESIGTLAVSQPSSKFGVLFELCRGRWMQWNDTRLAELAVPNLKERRLGIQLDVGILWANSLTDTNPGARHQSNECLVGMWSQRAFGSKGQSRLEEIGDLLGGV